MRISASPTRTEVVEAEARRRLVAQQQQRVGARKGMLGFGAMVREAREAEEEQAPSKRAKKMFTFGGRGD